MDAADEGIVGVITNHSWFESPIFAECAILLESFQRIYVLDLHGNAKRGERAPDGARTKTSLTLSRGWLLACSSRAPVLHREVRLSTLDLWGTRLFQIARHYWRGPLEASTGSAIYSSRACDCVMFKHRIDVELISKNLRGNIFAVPDNLLSDGRPSAGCGH